MVGESRLQVVEVDGAVLVASTTATRMPAMTALAALVPCALEGIRQTSRSVSPREWWYAAIASSPANSPCEPALGCSDTAS